MENDKPNTNKDAGSKKKKIVIGIVSISILLIILCIVLFNVGDPVKQAFSNLRDTIKTVIDPSANTTPRRKNIIADVSIKTKKADGDSSTDFVLSFRGNNEKSYLEIGAPDSANEIGLKVVTVKNEELYLRIDGINDVMKNSQNLSDLNSLAEFSSFRSTIEEMDGKWLYFSAPEIENELSRANDETVACFVNEYKNRSILKKAEEIYNKNQFFNYTKYTGEDISPTESGEIYEVKINPGQLLNFTKSLSDASSDKIKDCLNINSENSLFGAPEAIKEEDLPKIYVEIVGTDIVRAKIILENKNLEVDVKFSYPDKIDTPTPEKEKSIINMFSQLLSGQ